MSKTNIPWTDVSWNPVTGCTKISPGCKNCYAERMARRLAGRNGYPEVPNHFDVTLHHDRLEQPLKWRKPKRIFVCSMSDLFHEDVPFEFVEDVWLTMLFAKQHTFQVLTKRPARMRAFMERYSNRHCIHPDDMDLPYPNIWLGVSVENPDYLWRIEELRRTLAALRFVSLEPMLEPIDLMPYLASNSLFKAERYAGKFNFHGEEQRDGSIIAICRDGTKLYDGADLDWVIVGAESGPKANRRPFNPAWALDVYKQCQAAGVPFFGKQTSGYHPGVPLELPGIGVVQEWPKHV